MVDSNRVVDSSPEENSGGMSLHDIYFVIFRRKWIILLCFVLGAAAAAVLYSLKKPLYRSDSKLLVRYVVENKSPVLLGDNSHVRSADSGGNSIINSEIEILTSLDLFTQVAEAVGPARILKSFGGGDDKEFAAGVIARGISVEPPRGNIMIVTFRHPDPEVIMPVLERVIDEYLKRHAEVHRGLGALDVVLSQQADELRFQLNQTEEQLRHLKATNGVISIEETKATYIEEMSSLRRELFNTEAFLAGARATLQVLPSNGLPRTNSNVAGQTNAAPAEIPADTVTQYKEIVARLAALRQNEFALQSRYSDENALVKRAREQVAEVDKQRKDLEQKFPGLLQVPVAPSASPDGLMAGFAERARVVDLEAKVKALTNQLEKIRLEAAKLDEIESRLKQLQRKRDLDEANYRYFAAGLERSRFDESLGASRSSNISVVQKPTPPVRDRSGRLKMVAGALGGALGLGLALAFFLELVLDQSVRRVHEVEDRLRVPLFMAIPYVNGREMRRLHKKKMKYLGANGAPNGKEESLPVATAWENNHPLRPIFEGLRDRTILHFKNLNHKPKIIGISTCSEGAGSTTIAAGLAAALSEHGEGKVLLVDMHQAQASAHPFSAGKPGCEIQDVLEGHEREAGMVQENLYMALANDTTNRRLGLFAKQFSSLVPKLKASDYDFIIFDMPQVSATSPTLRLAGMMDIILLVVESEKVPRNAVKQAYSLLRGSGADAQVILNKVRSYIPSSLSGDL